MKVFLVVILVLIAALAAVLVFFLVVRADEAVSCVSEESVIGGAQTVCYNKRGEVVSVDGVVREHKEPEVCYDWTYSGAEKFCNVWGPPIDN